MELTLSKRPEVSSSGNSNTVNEEARQAPVSASIYEGKSHSDWKVFLEGH